MSVTTPAFRPGDRPDIKTVILLSAPGQAEEKAGRPATKQTGKNLQCAIEILHEMDPLRFPSANLDDYTIANAVEDIHYRKKTKRTEGKDSEVVAPANIARITALLRPIGTVIALGDKAQLAIKSSKFAGLIVAGPHPSMTKINTTYKSDKTTGPERHKDRMRQWVAELETRKT